MTVLIDHFDHFVVPVDDVLAAETFYTEVLGGRIARNKHGVAMRLGLSTRQFQAGSRPHTFFYAGGKRIGVYLQCEERPRDERLHGSPTFSFETTAAGLVRLAALLTERGVVHEGPVADDGKPAATSLFFNDPGNNHYHVYVPASPRNGQPAADGDLTGVGYLRLEAPDLDAGIAFYTETFGLTLERIATNPHLNVREAAIPLPSGQYLFLTETPFSPKGVDTHWNIPGPHLAFFVPGARWETLYQRLGARGIQNGDVLPELKGRKPGELDTYLNDPAGYRVQLVGEGIE